MKASALLWNRKFVIYDLEKNVLATIKQEPKSLLKKKFYVYIGDQQKAAITKEISVLPKFTIEGLDWQLHGAMRLEYEMLQNGLEVFSLHEEHTPWGRRPVLNIKYPEDELLALAVSMTISYAMFVRDEDNSAVKR